MSVRPASTPIPLSPSEEEERLALRALLRALLRPGGRDGRALYPVVYVGPLARGDLLEAELSACLEEGEGPGGALEPLAQRRDAPVVVGSVADAAGWGG